MASLLQWCRTAELRLCDMHADPYQAGWSEMSWRCVVCIVTTISVPIECHISVHLVQLGSGCRVNGACMRQALVRMRDWRWVGEWGAQEARTNRVKKPQPL